MLHVVATPIGNLADLSPRALAALRGAAAIACEDTRRTWQLLTHFEIPRPAEMFSYRQGNEERVTEKVLSLLAEGKDVALCSDGGYPGISDPGYRLIRACAKAGIPYDVVPGASAVEVALLMSGLSTSSFTFRGFPPRGPGALRNWFAEDADKEHTLICYESPFRVGATLAAALDEDRERQLAALVLFREFVPVVHIEVCVVATCLHLTALRAFHHDVHGLGILAHRVEVQWRDVHGDGRARIVGEDLRLSVDLRGVGRLVAARGQQSKVKTKDHNK